MTGTRSAALAQSTSPGPKLPHCRPQVVATAAPTDAGDVHVDWDTLAWALLEAAAHTRVNTSQGETGG